MTGDHPDLLGEAAHAATRGTIELASILTASARVIMQHQARTAKLRADHNDKALRAQHAREREQLAAARTRWAPASDPAWLGGAGLLDTAAAWGAAVPYSDPATSQYQQSAGTAVRNSEARLRDLHPSAMALLRPAPLRRPRPARRHA